MERTHHAYVRIFEYAHLLLITLLATAALDSILEYDGLRTLRSLSLILGAGLGIARPVAGLTLVVLMSAVGGIVPDEAMGKFSL